jgi:hypothetical protein
MNETIKAKSASEDCGRLPGAWNFVFIWFLEFGFWSLKI